MSVQKETHTRYKLTKKQFDFANEYIKTGNAYQSAITAKYSKAYAGADSHKLINNKKVRAYIEERTKRLHLKTLGEQVDIHKSLNKLITGADAIDIFNQFIEEEIIEEETLTGRIIKKRRSVAINPQVLIKALELKAKLDGLLDRVDQEEKDYQMVSIVDDLGDDS